MTRLHSKPIKNAACRKCLFTPPPGLAQISLSSVGADASVRPPMLYRTSCKRCHCETSSQTGRGERAERCQWQKKRGERVAAVKISSVRRKAAQKFWAPQQGHPPPSPCTRSREQLFSQYFLFITRFLSCPLQYHKFLVVSILNLQVSCNYRLTSTRK